MNRAVAYWSTLFPLEEVDEDDDPATTARVMVRSLRRAERVAQNASILDKHLQKTSAVVHAPSTGGKRHLRKPSTSSSSSGSSHSGSSSSTIKRRSPPPPTLLDTTPVRAKDTQDLTLNALNAHHNSPNPLAQHMATVAVTGNAYGRDTFDDRIDEMAMAANVTTAEWLCSDEMTEVFRGLPQSYDDVQRSQPHELEQFGGVDYPQTPPALYKSIDIPFVKREETIDNSYDLYGNEENVDPLGYMNLNTAKVEDDPMDYQMYPTSPVNRPATDNREMDTLRASLQAAEQMNADLTQQIVVLKERVSALVNTVETDRRQHFNIRKKLNGDVYAAEERVANLHRELGGSKQETAYFRRMASNEQARIQSFHRPI